MSANGSPPPAEPPKDEGASKFINIKVKDDKENEVFFKIKFTTKMSKIMEAYADRQGENRQSLRFFFEDSRIQNDDTPAILEMEEGDMIDVHQEQQGGSDSPPPADDQPEDASKVIEIVVKNQHGDEIAFKVKRTTPLSKLTTAWCKATETAADSVRFLYDGTRVGPNDTADSLEMENGDCLQAFLQQIGGDGSEAADGEQHESMLG